MSKFQPVVGSLSYVGAPRQVAAFSLGSQMAGERAFKAGNMAMGGMVGSLIALPAMTALAAALPVALLATPAVLGVGAAALAGTVGVGIFGAIKEKLEVHKAHDLAKRQKHYEAGGDSKSFTAQLKADGVGLVGRLMSHRAAKQAEKEVFNNSARGFKI